MKAIIPLIKEPKGRRPLLACVDKSQDLFQNVGRNDRKKGPRSRDELGILPSGVSKMKYLCPVCGYTMDDPPRDYNICPSCGTEFGYHDSGRTYEELRWTWLNAGAEWWSPVDEKPPGWNPYQQLFKAGLGFQPTAASTTSGAQPSNIINVTRDILEPRNWALGIHYQVTTAAVA